MNKFSLAYFAAGSPDKDLLQNQMPARIRIATTNDASAMLEIYAPFILNSGITQETELPSVEEFQKRIVSNLETRPWLVCELDDRITGYAYASSHRERKGYQWCVEVSVYIHENFYRYGIAHALYTALFDILKCQGYVNAYAVITLPNEKSISFHKKFGFEDLTTYPKIGYKLGKWHDVGWMQYEINPHEPDPPDPIKFPAIDRSAIESILEKGSKLIRNP